MNNPKLTPERLLRKAIVYVRQSKPSQLIHNQESTRLQLSLADRARSLGFQRIIVIDDDLGRSGSGLVDRPGFQRLAAEVCSGEVGAVFCVEASRLARNGRDWHYLIEMCGMVGAVVVDLDGIYDPTLTNDRLLLGMKGTIRLSPTVDGSHSSESHAWRIADSDPRRFLLGTARKNGKGS